MMILSKNFDFDKTGFPKNEGCTRNFFGRRKRRNVGDEFYRDRIRANTASVDDVGDGSRLPTRSNRKTIATGNLRPRRPTYGTNYAE